MIIIYGHRSYGTVDEQAGQYAITRFAHIYYMPIIPTGSFWVTRRDRAIPIGLNFKSVVAAYARTWGLLVGGGMLISGFSGAGIALALLGLVILAASLASWTWAKRRTEEAKLRGNLNALAFGSYCAPERLSGAVRQHLQADLTRRQQLVEGARPPEDVARYGTRNLDELVRSYGILGLHSSGAAKAQLAELLELKAPSGDVRDGVYRDNYTDTAGGKASLLPAERAAVIQAIEAAASQRLLA